MIDKEFMQQVRETKQSHERFMTAILASDVFPGLDTANPLDSVEVDKIPDRFGPQWFSYEREERKKAEETELAGQEECVFSKIDSAEVADLDSLIDQ